MNKPIFALACALTILPLTASAAPSSSLTRTVHLEISDPGDPSGGITLDTSLVGERACSAFTLDDRTTRRKVTLCTSGSAEKPYLDVRLERGGAAGAVDVQFSAATASGARTRVGKIALDAKKSLEVHATLTTAAP
ncbi:MAG: hypothetical protein F9K40_20360 [Kofleriaceae bacterium]|nr:MAG: hypothetical protein F9K40_20360 [Kofleriaceae bacterium]MBZ0235737.1 hypothetical protein [Kofleriaceae bacterium]